MNPMPPTITPETRQLFLQALNGIDGESYGKINFDLKTALDKAKQGLAAAASGASINVEELKAALERIEQEIDALETRIAEAEDKPGSVGTSTLGKWRGDLADLNTRRNEIKDALAKAGAGGAGLLNWFSQLVGGGSSSDVSVEEEKKGIPTWAYVAGGVAIVGLAYLAFRPRSN